MRCCLETNHRAPGSRAMVSDPMTGTYFFDFLAAFFAAFFAGLRAAFFAVDFLAAAFFFAAGFLAAAFTVFALDAAFMVMLLMVFWLVTTVLPGVAR